LNIESGLNDGLALPAVLVLTGLAGGSPAGWSTGLVPLLLEVAAGVALGIGLPLLVNQFLRLPGVGAEPHLLPLGPLAVAILLYGACLMLHANQFLAAFVAGSTVATVRPAASEAFRRTGELVSEMAKGAALLTFASLVDVAVLDAAGVVGVVFALGVVAVSRPAPVLAALSATRLAMRDRMAIAWFGPKGFASVAYAVIVAFSGMSSSSTVVDLVTVTVLLSVVAHSSTDVAVAGWLARHSGAQQEQRAAPTGEDAAPRARSSPDRASPRSTGG
jgi:NhaP-type Na+/H+ or K+/H+ antiporter